MNRSKGVSVVAGVNGLGKTTFLNVLLRLLCGRIDWRADGRYLGNLDHRLCGLKDAVFFRAGSGWSGSNSKVSSASCVNSSRLRMRNLPKYARLASGKRDLAPLKGKQHDRGRAPRAGYDRTKVCEGFRARGSSTGSAKTPPPSWRNDANW